MTNFSITADHMARCEFGGGPPLDAPVALAMQHLYDQAYTLWVEAGRPTLPWPWPSPGAYSTEHWLPEFAVWLYHTTAQDNHWFVAQYKNDPSDNAALFWLTCCTLSGMVQRLWTFD